MDMTDPRQFRIRPCAGGMAFVAPNVFRFFPPAITDNLAAVCACWRNRARQFFFDNDTTDVVRTKRWLMSQTQDNDSIYFYLHDGRPMAHCGLKWHPNEVAELSGLIRGESGGPRDMMVRLESAVCEEAKRQGAREVIARLYDWNWLAAALHKRCGFTERERVDGRITMVKL